MIFCSNCGVGSSPVIEGGLCRFCGGDQFEIRDPDAERAENIALKRLSVKWDQKAAEMAWERAK